MHPVLAVNGSIHGASGNTARLLRHALGPAAPIVHLVDEPDLEAVVARIAAADALLVGTGTYWDSCGSPLQRLIEAMTPLEGTAAVLGKPAGFLVTCEIVGGKVVLDRLQGVFGSMGFLLPPMSGVVLSRVAALAHEAIGREPVPGYGELADLWATEDLHVVVANLHTALQLRRLPWTTWSVQEDTRPTWPIPEHAQQAGEVAVLGTLGRLPASPLEQALWIPEELDVVVLEPSVVVDDVGSHLAPCDGDQT